MDKIKPIFKDKNRQALFEKNGFVKVPLLNEQQADELAEFYNSTRLRHEVVKTLQHTTIDTHNPDLMSEVDAKIKSVCTPELEKIMTNFKTLASYFYIKEAGGGSAIEMHQDPTFVDESRYCSANVWVALQDTDRKNGNLFFVSGSNRVTEYLRPIAWRKGYYDSYFPALHAMAVHVPLKKGQAVILNNLTIHGSADNLSNQSRLGATILVCSEEAQWQLYYKDKDDVNGKIEEYFLDFKTFATMPKDRRPDRKAFRQLITYNFPVLSEEEFRKRLGRDVKRGRNYFQMIKNVLGRILPFIFCSIAVGIHSFQRETLFYAAVFS